MATTTTAPALVKTTKYASLVGPLSPDQYAQVKQSIDENGLYDPITINPEGDVLDGHHRFKICQELKIEPTFKVKEFDSELKEKLFVIDSNLARRQMSDCDKILLAAKREEIVDQTKTGQEHIKAGKPLPDGQERVNTEKLLAKISGLSRDKVHKVKYVERFDQDSPDQQLVMGRAGIGTDKRTYHQIFTDMRKDRTTINKAYKLVKRDQDFIQARAETERSARELNLSSIFAGDINRKVKLLNVDMTTKEAFDSVPDDSVDLIFCDPPYTNRHMDGAYEGLAKLASVKLKPGGSLLFYFGRHELLHLIDIFREHGKGLTYWWINAIKHEITKTTADSGVFHDRGIRIQWKPMLWFVKGEKRLFNRQVLDYVQSKRPDKTLHPWAQSYVEAEYYIKNLTMSEHSVVMDPFLGGGSFAIPAIRLNRYFIGMEIDRDIFESATNYIMKEVAAAAVSSSSSSSSPLLSSSCSQA